MARMKIRNVLSLFDGISCGQVALERAGIKYDNYYASEIDEFPIKVTMKNYPNTIQLGDCLNIDYSKLINVDLLIGGSPCTYWSSAQNSNKRETTPDGIGGQLFMEYVRALKETKPKYFIYENNFSINKNIKEFITNKLGVKPIMINSNLISAQDRKRLYWTNIPNIKNPLNKHIYLQDIINNKLPTRPIGDWVFKTWKGGKKIKLDMLRKLTDSKSFTLTTKKCHSGNYYLTQDKKEYRNLNITEWEMLQTLPVDYTKINKATDTERHKAVGNGWTVDVIVHILNELKEQE